MEEKKFPWLLRLLAGNSSKIPLLDTYAINQQRIIAIFRSSSDYCIEKKSCKSLKLTNTKSLINYLLTNSFSSKHPIKHSFFLHKGKRSEIPIKDLKSYNSNPSGIPFVSYIQSTPEPFSLFLVFSVEYAKQGYRSSLFPSVSHPGVFDQAKEISKSIISLIEAHENKKILKIDLEFMMDKGKKLWLANVHLCQMTSAEKIEKMDKKESSERVVENLKSNELLEMITELDSPSKVFKRKPSMIKKIGLELKTAERVKIESPNYEDSDSDSSIQVESADRMKELTQRSESGKGNKVNKDFLELLCRTRIVGDEPKKKILIRDEEYREEYMKVKRIIDNAHQVNVEAKNWIKNSGKFRKLKKSGSVMLSEIKINNKRSSSMIELLHPVLTRK